MANVCTNRRCPAKRRFWKRLRSPGTLFLDQWYCSPECLRPRLERGVRESLEQVASAEASPRRSRLGAILLQGGLVTRLQLNEALRHQNKHGGSIGRWLVRLGFISDRVLIEALSRQQSIPWIEHPHPTVTEESLGVLPRRLCLALRIAPLEFNVSTRLLLIGMSGPGDVKILHMLRKMLPVPVRVFLTHDEIIAEALSRFVEPFTDETSEDVNMAESDASTVSELILDHSGRTMDEIRVHCFEATLWVRYRTSEVWRNLFLIFPGQQKFAQLAGKDLPLVITPESGNLDITASSFTGTQNAT